MNYSETLFGQRVRGLIFDSENGSPTRGVLFLGCLGGALAATVTLGDDPGLSVAAYRALFILVFSVLLWVTEAIPAFSVGVLILGLQIALLGNPHEGVYAHTDRDWEQFVAVLGHPLIWLFFGGFVLAAGIARCGLDRWLATRLLAPFGSRPANVLLGVMLTTFVLSMFMSNTATAAMILAMLAPVLASLDRADRFAKGLLIGMTVAANLGGMGSLIGTPPNAIAVGALADLEPAQSINFLEWLLIGMPPALCGLLVAWQVLVRLYPSSATAVTLPVEAPAGEGHARPAWQKTVVAGTMILTIGMWLTSQWHGVPTAAVSFIAIVLLTTTGVLGVEQIRGLSYDVLFLIAGGLALGQMVTKTGLSDWIVAHLPLDGLGPAGLAILLAYATVVLSNFMSNTAAANVLVPLGVALASGFEATTAVLVAFGASAAMCLPVATPPNAIAYATGKVDAADFVKIGLVTGVAVPAFGAAWLWLVSGAVLGSGG